MNGVRVVCVRNVVYVSTRLVDDVLAGVLCISGSTCEVFVFVSVAYECVCVCVCIAAHIVHKSIRTRNKTRTCVRRATCVRLCYLHDRKLEFMLVDKLEHHPLRASRAESHAVYLRVYQQFSWSGFPQPAALARTRVRWCKNYTHTTTSQSGPVRVHYSVPPHSCVSVHVRTCTITSTILCGACANAQTNRRRQACVNHRRPDINNVSACVCMPLRAHGHDERRTSHAVQ